MWPCPAAETCTHTRICAGSGHGVSRAASDASFADESADLEPSEESDKKKSQGAQRSHGGITALADEVIMRPTAESNKAAAMLAMLRECMQFLGPIPEIFWVSVDGA
jgi:hypothetical protein